MLIKTQIVINKNTQQFHMGHRFDQLITNIKIKKTSSFWWHLNNIAWNLDGFAFIWLFSNHFNAKISAFFQIDIQDIPVRMRTTYGVVICIIK